MKKYLTVFGLSFQNEFVYRLNFILWRVRNVLRILLTYFLWNSVFTNNTSAFGYTKEQMITYVFWVLLVTSLVSAAPSNDNVVGDISTGDLGNYLVKPMSYLKYWLTRDWASKLLNIIFAFFEIAALIIIFRPHLFVPGVANIFFGVIASILAALIYFWVTKIFVLSSFWTPENTWGLMFVFLVFLELFSGALFPLDVLPKTLYNVLLFTPFPYLTYLPVGILVGKFSPNHALSLFAGSIVWLGLSYFLSKTIWKKGLVIFSDTGR